MRVRIYSQEKDEDINSISAKGRTIVKLTDNVGFRTHEIRLKAGDTQDLKPLDGYSYNHMYYCIIGDGKVVCSNGSMYTLIPKSLLALANTTTASVTATSNMRILVTFVEAKSPPPVSAKFVPISSIIGTERDVDWTRGRSRRYLTRADGFGLSIHNTTVDPQKDSPLQYKNQHELAYYYYGDIRYDWDDGKSTASLDMDSIQDDTDGIAFLMDNQDAHVIRNGSRVSECMCVFNPPLMGTEKHDFLGGGPSVY